MRSLWLGLGLVLVGGLALHGAGCSGSNSNGGGGPGGASACCLCASPECGTQRVVPATDPGSTISDCKAFCQSKFFATCAMGNQSDVTGIGVSCPPDGGPSTGVGGAGGAAGLGGSSGSAGSARGGSSQVGDSAIRIDGSIQNFGSPCSSNADCGALQCITDLGTVMSGNTTLALTYPNGVCSLPCSGTSNPCPALGGTLGATCTRFSDSPNGICLQLCDIGIPAPAPDVKCAGRPDQACQPINPQAPATNIACLPNCESDADCGTRKCLPSVGICIDQPVTPSPIGAPCTIDSTGASNDCGDGFCLALLQRRQTGFDTVTQPQVSCARAVQESQAFGGRALSRLAHNPVLSTFRQRH